MFWNTLHVIAGRSFSYFLTEFMLVTQIYCTQTIAGVEIVCDSAVCLYFTSVLKVKLNSMEQCEYTCVYMLAHTLYFTSYILPSYVIVSGFSVIN
jgi:hypothetical protein